MPVRPPAPRRPSRRPLRTAAALLVALGLLGACSGGGDGDDAAETTTTAAPTTTTLATFAPLTGLPVTDPGAISGLARPALIVKIDNADGAGRGARPQIGLNQADVVFEEMVEGSVTRLATVFHSQDAEVVGPVRSARATDVAIAEPLNRPLYAWSGGNKATAALIRASALRDVGFDAQSSAYSRQSRGGHRAPHNLYTSTPALFALAADDAGPPPPLFQYRTADQAPPATAAAAGSVHITFGGGPGSAPVDWSWDAAQERFLRRQKGTPHVDETGAQIAVANVIVMFVPYRATGDQDSAGNSVPEADLVGTGTVWVMTDGKLVEGTWSKPAKSAVPTFVDAAGDTIQLTPGQTWVELAPPGSSTR